MISDMLTRSGPGTVAAGVRAERYPWGSRSLSQPVSSDLSGQSTRRSHRRLSSMQVASPQEYSLSLHADSVKSKLVPARMWFTQDEMDFF